MNCFRQLTHGRSAVSSMLLVFCGCSGTSVGSHTCGPGGGTGVSSQAIYAGSDEAAYLALGSSQRDAVVRIEAEVDGAVEPRVCSGTLIRGGVVLTAGHCMQETEVARVRLLVGPTAENPTAVYTIEDVQLHPALDVAMLRLHSTDAANIAAEGITTAAAIEDVWVGRRVTLAGYGFSDTGQADVRLFATEEVENLEPDSVITNGRGVSGGCLGDSGGPLLARDKAGEVTLLGVLSSGSTTCRGRDYFTRVDRVAAWLAAHGAGGVTEQGCGQLSFSGRCFDGQPVWCEADRAATEECTGTRLCGWDEVTAGYRCVEPTEACAGADAFGACLNGSLHYCAAALDLTESCGDCGRCAINSVSGMAGCFELAP